MKRLYRNTTDGKIAGVCSGIGDYFEIDPVIIRLLFLATFFLGAGPIVYLIALVVSVVGAYQLIGSHQWLIVLTGHLIATVVVFIASQIYKNSSLYDPFWSVAPIPIAIYVALWPESTEINIEKVLLILIPIVK